MTSVCVAWTDFEGLGAFPETEMWLLVLGAFETRKIASSYAERRQTRLEVSESSSNNDYNVNEAKEVKDRES